MEDLLKNKIILLLKSEAVIEIESKIVEQKKCNIYKDDLSFLANLIIDEVNTSELSIEELIPFINSNRDEIIEFAICFLDGRSPKSLSTGITITYSIYLIYLKDKGDKLLEEYIKRRRIPNPRNFLIQLKKVNENTKKS